MFIYTSMPNMPPQAQSGGLSCGMTMYQQYGCARLSPITHPTTIVLMFMYQSQLGFLSFANVAWRWLPWSQRFFLIFLRDERTRAVKEQTQVAKQLERKTSGNLGLESHFHADASCQTCQIYNNNYKRPMAGQQSRAHQPLIFKAG